MNTTTLLGDVLLTAYLGGAIASNLRVDKPRTSTVMFPVDIAIAAWSGVYGRNSQLRTIAVASALLRGSVAGRAGERASLGWQRWLNKPTLPNG
jgi:hypothetical protein